MKCIFTLDQDVNPATMAESEKAKVKFRSGKTTNLTGKVLGKVVPYFPAGTEYEHPNAAFFVLAGSAIPGDKECTDAVKAEGMTDEDLAALQHRYKRADLGIEEADVPLYDAGVILGYDPKSPDGYIHGPQWEAYQAAMKQVEAEAAAKQKEESE